MNHDDYEALLIQASNELRHARSNLAVANYNAKTIARDAIDDGMSEVELARLLGVSRHTVRAWLGKPRKR